MNNDVDLPTNRPMPIELQEHLWNRLRPEVAEALAGRRRRSPVLPLVAAAAVGTLVVGGVLVFGQAGPSERVVPAADPADARLARDCVDATIAAGVDVPDPGDWVPAVKIEAGTAADNGAVWPEFLVVRTDAAAAICLVSGQATGGMTGADVATMEGRGRHGYATLTAARPFDYIDAWNFHDGTSIQFGIASADVVSVSVVRQDGTETPALLRDGTFAVKIDRGELCGTPPDFATSAEDSVVSPAGSNVLRVTLSGGQVVEGPLCKPAA
ncbi:hypothetical protein ACFFQW_10805 [Umezawaea endophytica]|uniref:Uncharacterized protein n=1 Tax=Umezawaea endophytica TaxID=1654476 RepID=A0A9X2VVP1_9PSEU|nr:hypothetical protein [Umezawaea endophytica]MCS7483544.1 hypothetical protein [Umezawaea endophytica]